MRELSNSEIQAVDGAWSTGDIAGALLGGIAGVATGGILLAVGAPVLLAAGVGFGASVLGSLAWSAATEQPKVDVPKVGSVTVSPPRPVGSDWTTMEGMGNWSSVPGGGYFRAIDGGRDRDEYGR